MSKELPYFKFFTGEWLNGDITLEDYELQGLFINVCAYYWHRECVVNYEQLKKKFKTNLIVDLIPEFISCNEDTQEITIEFLDEQFFEFTTRKKKLSEAGKKGVLKKKQLAEIKPPLSHPEAIRVREDKDKNEIIEDNIPRFSFKAGLMDLGLNTLLISEWLKVRKSKKLTNSETAFNALKKQFDLLELEPKEIIRICVENSWGGFKAEWIKNKENGTKGYSKDNRATTTKAGRQQFD